MSKQNSIWKKVGIGAGVLILILVIAKSAGIFGDSNAIKVSTDKVVTRDIEETVSANGKVQPEVELKISADVSGEIVDLFVKEGDLVKKGALLCRINPEIYASNLDRTSATVNGAKANLENTRSRLVQSQSQLAKAESDYNRSKKLFDEKVISASDFESVKSSWEVAKAEVEASKQSIASSNFNVRSAEASLKESVENLNKTNIYAAVNGTVSSLSKEKGERVVGTNMMEGTEIMRLANLNEMEVSVDVSENDIVRVSVNDTAMIDIDAYIGRKFMGVVTEVANSANVSSASITDQVTNFTVKIRILRDSYKDMLEGKSASFSPFRPGMSASVDIRTKRVRDVIALPIQAVTTRDTAKKEMDEKDPTSSTSTEAKKKEDTPIQECVFVIEDGKAKIRTVKTGIQDNMWIQVLDGLKAGDVVISAPYNAISKTLKDGATVKVVKRDELFEKDKSK